MEQYREGVKPLNSRGAIVTSKILFTQPQCIETLLHVRLVLGTGGSEMKACFPYCQEAPSLEEETDKHTVSTWVTVQHN